MLKDYARNAQVRLLCEQKSVSKKDKRDVEAVTVSVVSLFIQVGASVPVSSLQP